MARFVAKYAKFRHPVRPDVYMNLASGARELIQTPLVAVFSHDLASVEEREFGLRAFRHAGLPIDKDTEEHISPSHRISAFDSELAAFNEGWSDEERELVEKTLRESTANGIDFLEFIPAPPAAPWANYDELEDGAAIALIAQATGAVQAALAYERATKKRASVIEALEAPAKEEEDTVLIQA